MPVNKPYQKHQGKIRLGSRRTKGFWFHTPSNDPNTHHAATNISRQLLLIQPYMAYVQTKCLGTDMVPDYLTVCKQPTKLQD